MSKFSDIIQNYNELRLRVNLFNQYFTAGGGGTDKLLLGHIQKIYSTHHYLAFSLRFPGRSLTLYLGRGSGHEGLHWLHSLPPSPLRVRDRFLEFVRKYMVGAYLNPIEVARGDRVLHLTYSRAHTKSYLSLFYKGRQLYFAHAEQVEPGRYKLFASWAKLEQQLVESSEEQIKMTLERLFAQVGAHYTMPDDEAPGEIGDTHDVLSSFFSSFKHSEEQLGSKQKKFITRKIANIEKDLARVQKWSELKRTVEAPYFKFDEDYRQTICGIKFTFPSGLNHFKKMGIVYDKVKALKKGEDILLERLSESRQQLLRGSQQQKCESYHLPEKISSPVWSSREEVEASALISKDSGGIHEYSWRGIKWAIGMNAQGNDFLRSRWANKDDLWFHLDGDTSPHLVVKRPDLADIREEFLGIIASMIVDTAGIQCDPIALIYTQVKNLKGIKGRAGAVIHKKTRHLTLRYNSKWKEIISAA